MKNQMQYTITVTQEGISIYIRQNKEEEFELSARFGINDGQVSAMFVHKLIELANCGYNQVPQWESPSDVF